VPTTTPTVVAGAATADAVGARPTTATGASAGEATTRHRVLRLIAAAGPVSVVELAQELDLTTAGVRRHVAALEESGQVAAHAVAAHGQPRRGRPARRFVVTDRGQSVLTSAYSGLAAEAMDYLAQVGGDTAVQGFAAHRLRELEQRLVAAAVPDGTDEAAAAPDVAGRAAALALALADEGYAASSRPVPGGRAVQLCQGHCPVQDVAARYPQLCEAEAQMFSRVLGVHVQRLSTIAAGGHVCTTHIPTHVRTRVDMTTTSDPVTTDRPASAGTVEGTR
jgi:predicted ArsR family transcriptional regulator